MVSRGPKVRARTHLRGSRGASPTKRLQGLAPRARHVVVESYSACRRTRLRTLFHRCHMFRITQRSAPSACSLQRMVCGGFFCCRRWWATDDGATDEHLVSPGGLLRFPLSEWLRQPPPRRLEVLSSPSSHECERSSI